MELHRKSALEVAELVRSKKISAVEVAKHFRQRIGTIDPKLNAFVTINEAAETEAKAIDDRLARGEDVGPLAGVPIAIKDLLCTEGLETTASSKILKGFRPPYSATVVRRLRAAGAIVTGKTSLDEFGMGSSNENAATGPVRNPWNTDLVPGGSSGGSAAAVASRMSLGAIGTDTGGSIRQPASFCGLYGIKPTYGRVSRFGIIAYASSLDQAGPMCVNTRDAAAFLEVIAGHCPSDSTSSRREVPRWLANINGQLNGVRIGLPKEYFGAGIDADTQQVVQTAVETVRKAGAEIVEISLPLVKYAIPVYYLVATSEASSNLARYDGIRYGHRASLKGEVGADIDDLYAASRGEGFGSEVKRRIMLGTYALSSGYYDAFYQKASQVRRMIRDEFLNAFKRCDVILSPVTTSPAFPLNSRIKNPLEMYLNDILTTSTNLAGLPGMSVHAGFSKSGLPIGVQLMAKHFDEQSIFNVSSAIETGTGATLNQRWPNVI